MAFELGKHLEHKNTLYYITNNIKNNENYFYVPFNITFLAHSLKIRKFIRSNNVDILHGHGLYTSLITLYISIITGVPYVVTINGRWPVLKFKNVYIRDSFIKFFPLYLINNIIYSSYYLQNFFKKYSIDPKNSYVVPYGIEEIWFSYQKNKIINHHIKKIVFFGDGTYERGLWTVVKTIPHIIQQYSTLNFILAIREWPDKDDKELFLRFKQLYPVNVIYYPFNPQIHIYHILNEADLVLLPFSINSMEPPISLLESMALGKMTITSKVGANSEIVKNYVNGIMIPKDNPEELILAIENIMKNQDKLLNIQKNSQKTIWSVYNWEKVIAKIESIYGELMW